MRVLTWVFLVLAVFGLKTPTCNSFVSKDVWALTRFKEAIFDDPYVVLSSWNGLDSDPCQWTGVYCSFSRDHVRKLNLSGSSLKGFLAPELGLMTNLEELILHGNKLMGTIPNEIFMLKGLKAMDLGMNQLTGPIPPEIGNLDSMMILNLQSNGLTGMLPPEIGNLKYLQELRLDRNRLHGTVPGNGTGNLYGMYASPDNATGLCRFSQLYVADLSYNFFIGTVPECLQYMPRSSFQGNCLQLMKVKQRTSAQCGTSAPTASPKTKPPDKAEKHSTPKPLWVLALKIVGGILGGFLLFTVLLTLLWRCNIIPFKMIPQRTSGTKKLYEVCVDPELLKSVHKFTRQELEIACEDFSNIIGSSLDTVVYKGIIQGGPEIAVISFCIKEEDWTGYHELYFQREVAELARLDHENVGKLRGYCSEEPPFTRMLVFEYASNGTLCENLHYGESNQLSWVRRMRIIVGIARGLQYLHGELNPPFTISQLNSSAVSLTEDFSSKLFDFESWKTILARSEKNACSVVGNGAMCILPSTIEDRHLDMEGNVYAFGVLVLEIVSGRPPFGKDQGHLVDWARKCLEQPERMSELVDSQLNYHGPEDLKVICEVARLCIDPNPRKRPSMADACSLLEAGINLSYSAELRSVSLAWAEVALMS